MKRIGIVLCALLLAGAATAQAQQRSPEDRYIADRDRAIARFTPEQVKKLGESAATAQSEIAYAALEKQMRAIVGPVEIAGLSESKLNLGSLYWRHGLRHARRALISFAGLQDLDRGDDAHAVVAMAARAPELAGRHVAAAAGAGVRHRDVLLPGDR
jgi:hypothetical protein